MNRHNDLMATILDIAQAGAMAASPKARRQQAPAGECAYCDRERAKGNSFHPPHDASRRCESGGHAHCTCDTCF